MMKQRMLSSYSPIQLCHISPLGYLLTFSEKGQSSYHHVIMSLLYHELVWMV